LKKAKQICFVLSNISYFKNGSIILKEYFFLSLSVVVFRHKDKVAEIFSGIKSAER